MSGHRTIIIGNDMKNDNSQNVHKKVLTENNISGKIKMSGGVTKNERIQNQFGVIERREWNE